MQRGEAKWSAGAAALLTRVPASQYPRLKLRIEKEAVIAHEPEVTARTVFAAQATATLESRSFAYCRHAYRLTLVRIVAAQPDPSALFQSPVTFAYEAHAGPVYGTSFSPFHRNLFLSVATDASVRLYNMLQPQPLLVTEPCATSLYACSWSPAR